MYKKRGLRFEYITLLLVLSFVLVLYIVNAVTYNIGSGADYNDISACLFFLNSSTDLCQLNDANTVYNMSGSQVWLSDADLFNKSGMIFGFNFSNTGGYAARDVS